MNLPNIGRSEFVAQVQSTILERNDIVSTLAEQWMEEGEKRGRQSIVRRQIELKFGPLDSRGMSRLDAADDVTLERYAARVLTATSVEEALGE